MSSFVSIVLLLCGAVSATPVSTDLPIVIDRISDRVVVAEYVSSRVTAIATERGVIVVDSHRSPTIMRAALASIEAELGRSDWAWLVNTHGHWDHTWGNQALEGVAHMGHERCAEYIDGHAARARLTAWRQESNLERLRSELDEMDEATPNRSKLRVRTKAQEVVLDDLHHRFVPTPPDETFTDRAHIDGGDVTADLIFCGSTHTDHDVFIFIPEENILLTGDVFCSGNSLCFGVNALTDTDRMLSVIDEILERAPDVLTVIPGHGDVLSRDDLVRLRGILEERAAEVDADASAAHRVERGESLDGREETLYFDEEEFHVLARRYIGRGRLDLALEVLEIAIEHLPDSALLHNIFGETLFHMGNTSGARDHYERSLELSPDNRNAERVLELLEAGD